LLSRYSTTWATLPALVMYSWWARTITMIKWLLFLCLLVL
jgi:hypothetical protein